MSEINNWDTSADDNNDSPPDGFPEGMVAQAFNNSMREVMAAMKRYYDMLYSIPETTYEAGENSRHYKVVLPETITEYRDGLTFRMRIHEAHDGVSAPTIKVGNLPRINIRFTHGSGTPPFDRNEIIEVTYDSLSVPPAFRMIGRLPVLHGLAGRQGPAGVPDVSTNASKITGGTLSTARLNIASSSGVDTSTVSARTQFTSRDVRYGAFNVHAYSFWPYFTLSTPGGQSQGRAWLLAAEFVGQGPSPPVGQIAYILDGVQSGGGINYFYEYLQSSDNPAIWFRKNPGFRTSLSIMEDALDPLNAVAPFEGAISIGLPSDVLIRPLIEERPNAFTAWLTYLISRQWIETPTPTTFRDTLAKINPQLRPSARFWALRMVTRDMGVFEPEAYLTLFDIADDNTWLRR